MTAFLLGRDIENPDLLWGRKNQIDNLSAIAARGENATIIGSRRYGKTCLLKSMATHLRATNSPAYPIFFDAKSEMVSGDTCKFYRYIVSRLMVQLYSDQFLSGPVFRLGSKEVTLSNDWVDVNEQLKDLSIERIQRALLDLADELSSQDKYLLLLLDEIDYVLQGAFEDPSHFMWIRNAASESDRLKFWIAATSSWGSLCKGVGSPELNCGLQEFHVQPLNKSDFHLLWSHECAFIEDEMLRYEIQSEEDWVYQESGGVPFYAKTYGAWLLLHRGETRKPDYSILCDHFNQLVDNKFITPEEVELLHRLSIESMDVEDNRPAGMLELCRKGLVVIVEDEYIIPVGAFRSYLKATCQPASQSETNQEEARPITKIPELVDEILRLREEINQIWKDEQLWDKEPYRKNANASSVWQRNTYPPFCSNVEEWRFIRDMKQICLSENDYQAFSTALYLFYYEGSRKASNLPLGFALSRNNDTTDTPSDFLQLICTNRHCFGGHSNYQASTTNMSKTDLLTIINNGRQPTQGDYARIQYDLLAMCKAELEKMFAFLQDLC